MDDRRVTFQLPEELVQRAEVYAWERKTTIDNVVREILQNALATEERTAVAIETLISLAAKGPYFSQNPTSISREELHERRG